VKESDTILMTIQQRAKPCKNIWVTDSAASTHITNSNVGLYNTKEICKPVKIGDGKLVYATKVGQLKVSSRPMKERTKNSC